MWTYLARRLLLAVPTLLGASIIVFAMVHLAPGDPIDLMVGEAIITGLTVSAVLLVARYWRVTKARINSAGQRPA